ncbi:HNH endonuclease signature motif containing protein [Microbacterium sp. KR10-403]|uniref:HNH endonuclease signature motif containing protein n=1 Tax=Microbacterium sp. KR10-403 TaxID=3158581 RepID=UPI0032E3CCD3
MTNRTCVAHGCDRDAVARGWCLKHYKRERRRVGGKFTRKTPAERLADGLKRMPNGCLEWQRTRNEDGYGSIYVNGVTTLTHRFAWEIENGPIPDGLNILHRCDNPPCCDPSHLFLGTQAENVDDMVSKRRHMNNRRTHCQRGHEFTAENTRIDERGNRRCVTCERAYQRKWHREHYVPRSAT